MAFLYLAPSGKYHVGFRYAGRQWKQSLNTANPQLAERARLRLEENLRLVEEGRLDMPPGVNVAEFLLYDGKLMFVACPTPAETSFDDGISPAPSECCGRQTPVASRSNVAAAANLFSSQDGHDSLCNGQAGVIAMPLGEVIKAYLKQLPTGALAEGNHPRCLLFDN